jgi:hypothetical protein
LAAYSAAHRSNSPIERTLSSQSMWINEGRNNRDHVRKTV